MSEMIQNNKMVLIRIMRFIILIILIIILKIWIEEISFEDCNVSVHIENPDFVPTP